MKDNKFLESGFTLLEILLVIGIIAVLAGIVIVALNPGKMLASARNTERKSDLKQINDALQQYYIDHREYPSSLLGTLTEVCKTGAVASSSVAGVYGANYCNGLVDLSVLVPVYLPAIPADPQATTTGGAGYKVIKYSSGGKIGLSASAELGQTITINIPSVVADTCSHSASDPNCWSTAQGGLAWGPEGVTTGVQSITDGATNTATLAGLTGVYPAADYCASLTEGGHSDWYLPAKNQVIAGLTAYKSHYGSDPTWGGFTPSPLAFYWSSTEYSDDPDWYAWYADYNNSYDEIFIDAFAKSDSYSYYKVRCLR